MLHFASVTARGLSTGGDVLQLELQHGPVDSLVGFFESAVAGVQEQNSQSGVEFWGDPVAEPRAQAEEEAQVRAVRLVGRVVLRVEGIAQVDATAKGPHPELAGGGERKLRFEIVAKRGCFSEDAVVEVDVLGVYAAFSAAAANRIRLFGAVGKAQAGFHAGGARPAGVLHFRAVSDDEPTVSADGVNGRGLGPDSG